MGWQDRAIPATGSWQDRATPTAEPAPEISKTESALRGAAQVGTAGLADEATGALEALRDEAYGNAGDKSFGDLYRQHRDESRAAYDAAHAANPKSYLAGELAGGLATAFIPGLNVAKGATTAARVGRAAALGGAMGFGNSTQDVTQGHVAGAAFDTAVGAGAGALGQTALEKVVGPKLSDVGRYILGRGQAAESAAAPVAAEGAGAAAEAAANPTSPSTRDVFTGNPSPNEGAPVISDAEKATNKAANQGWQFPVREKPPEPFDLEAYEAANAPAPGSPTPALEATPTTPEPPADPNEPGWGATIAKKAAGMVGDFVGGKVGGMFGLSRAGAYTGREAGEAVAKYGPQVVRQIVGSKIFSADTLDRIAASKFAGLIGSAAQRGNNALSTASFLLSQTDPEFRQLTQASGK